MHNNDEKISRLEQKIADLEARLAKLTDKNQRDVNALMGCDDILDKHRKVMNAELEDAFERLVKLEMKAYPHLIESMNDLFRVIGDDDTKAHNPLDFRDRSKKSR